MSIETKIDQTPTVKGQTVTAQRCVRIDDTYTLRLAIRVDSSYPAQTRIVTDLHDESRWQPLWTYSHEDFESLPNAYSKQDQKMLPHLLLPIYERMVADARRILL